MATVQGVYTATVLDNRDPQGLARVLVRVAGLDEALRTRGVWARVATLMAGQDRGTVFTPQPGDEVLVAFEHGDPRVPYVIGALWNGASRPPGDGDGPSTVTMIRSRSGVTFSIRDGEATSRVIIETPGGQRITLEDGPGSVRVEDANGNAVTMTPAGVTIAASARVTLNASTLEVNAGTLTVNAGMARFTGVVQCDTMISNAVVSASYTPGAGNRW